jgi:hypothetical protein
MASAATGFVMLGGGTAFAAGVDVPGVGSANTCPQGYYGVVAGTTATGPAYVCENVF